MLAALFWNIALGQHATHVFHLPGFKTRVVAILNHMDAWAFKGPKMHMARWLSFIGCFLIVASICTAAALLC